MRVCVTVCVCVRPCTRVYTCVSVCVTVCMWGMCVFVNSQYFCTLQNLFACLVESSDPQPLILQLQHHQREAETVCASESLRREQKSFQGASLNTGLHFLPLQFQQHFQIPFFEKIKLSDALSTHLKRSLSPARFWSAKWLHRPGYLSHEGALLFITYRSVYIGLG